MTHKQRHVRNRRRDVRGGFTLVELLVVLVILSLVMSLIGPRVLGYLSSSRERTAKLQMQSFATALDLFYLDMGRYPSMSEGLTALARPTAGDTRWSGPYVRKGDVPPDPWGRPFVYRAQGSGKPYLITSLGADGRAGGDGENADISNE